MSKQIHSCTCQQNMSHINYTKKSEIKLYMLTLSSFWCYVCSCRICFGTLGFPSTLHAAPNAANAFVHDVATLYDFLADTHRDNDTVQIPTPKVLPLSLPPPPMLFLWCWCTRWVCLHEGEAHRPRAQGRHHYDHHQGVCSSLQVRWNQIHF